MIDEGEHRRKRASNATNSAAFPSTLTGEDQHNLLHPVRLPDAFHMLSAAFRPFYLLTCSIPSPDNYTWRNFFPNVGHLM